jgi:hypothetical protein
MFDSNGEITPPCGVPRWVSMITPFSITPALSQRPISFSTFRSEIRCRTASISSSWSMLSKYFSMSASTTQSCPALPAFRIASSAS